MTTRQIQQAKRLFPARGRDAETAFFRFLVGSFIPGSSSVAVESIPVTAPFSVDPLGSGSAAIGNHA